MTSIVGVAAVALVLGYPVADLDELDARYYPVRMRGMACERLADLKPMIELMATMTPETTLGTATEQGRAKGLRCDHYDALMYDVGAVADAEGLFEVNGRSYRVRHLLLGTMSYHVSIYVANSAPTP